MTFPPPRPPSNSSSAASNSSSLRAKPDPWGPSISQAARRDPSPVLTSFNSAIGRPSSSSQTLVSRNPWSPAASAASANASAFAANRQATQSPSVSSSTSAVSAPPGFPQATSASLAGTGRSRTIASVGQSQQASAAAGSTVSGGGASSGGASTRLSRASPSLSQSSFTSPTTSVNLSVSGAAQSGSLSKIVIAQLFLLLSSIKDVKDSAKWAVEAEKIRKLVDSHPSDVFAKYIQKLITSHASNVFGPNRGAEPTGSYRMLVDEMHKVTQDPSKAAQLVDSIENGDHEVFRDFDLSTYMEHFRLSPVGKVTLATAFKRASKSDLRTKADAIISNNLRNFLDTISRGFAGSEPTEPVLAAVICRLALFPPRSWNSDTQRALQDALTARYEVMEQPVPPEISSAYWMFDLMAGDPPLIHLLHRSGPKATENPAAAKSLLDQASPTDINAESIASAILFMAISSDDVLYDLQTFVSALREHRAAQRLDWQDVIRAFDRNALTLTPKQFRCIYDNLLPIARDTDSFDIQLLWGGSWRHESTQLSFVAAFLSMSEEELDASQIPRLRSAYSVEDFDGAPEEVVAYALRMTRHPYVSLDAIRAMFHLAFHSIEAYDNAKRCGIVDRVINTNISHFVASATAVPKPWGTMQVLAVKTLLEKMLERTDGTQAEYNFALHLLWNQDPVWLGTQLNSYFQIRPLELPAILRLATTLNWMGGLIAAKNVLSLDLAALAHGQGIFDIEHWLSQIASEMPPESVAPALQQFLANKIDDDIAAHKEQGDPVFHSIPLHVKTAHSILTFLGGLSMAETDRINLQRSAVTAYPRLINYGQGYDDILDASVHETEQGYQDNTLPASADARMQEHLRVMWNGEQKVGDIVEILKTCRQSRDVADQEFFACMIFGLFDEFNCFGQYPLSALQDTAVLFGNIIDLELISKIALQVALSMVLEAVRDSDPNDLIFKFGLQALTSFHDRLIGWKKLSENLLEIPNLKGTEIYPFLEKAVESEGGLRDGDHEANGATNSADDFLAPEIGVPEFCCLSVDPPPNQDFSHDPDDALKESVMFVLNNVSERNLAEKTSELKIKIRPEHHQWFAHHLVETRIKPQPNFGKLYMDFLDFFDDVDLWDEVLRGTLASVIRMLNAESTMSSSNERTHLKTLGAWLGSMTIARNEAIKHKNISFKDLLIEAHDTQRLLVAIPFTCKVLGAVCQSVVFKPPCVWTTDILSILLELYHFAELKLNLKFEIEVLCNTLDVDHTEFEVAEVIRSRELLEEEPLHIPAVDGIEPFTTELGLMSLHRGRGMMDRFSPGAIVPPLAELTSVLKHNYPLPHPDAADRVRAIFVEAVERAVAEIIGAVVERSVTIAAIATSNLIQKDFALEMDVDKLRESAYTAVQSLAGSLASVTCKEPLRNQMLSNIQLLREQVPDHLFPVGSMVIFVNENIENVCEIVEKAAATASRMEIDTQLEEAIQERQTPNFAPDSVSRWANFIPDPFKIEYGGLNHQQLAIYQEFTRSARGAMSHTNNASQDGGRQIPDVLQDHFQPNFPPASESALIQQRLDDVPMQAHSMANGYANGHNVEARASELAKNFVQTVDAATEHGNSQQLADSPSIQHAWQQLRDHLFTLNALTRDSIILVAARELCSSLYTQPRSQAALDVLTQVLKLVCGSSPSTDEAVFMWCSDYLEKRIFNVPVTAALVKHNLVDIRRVDMVVAAAIAREEEGAWQFLDDFIGQTLTVDSPIILRGDLASSIAALLDSIDRGVSYPPAASILHHRLGPLLSGIDVMTNGAPETLDEHMRYVFEEWVRLQANIDNPAMAASFAQQLQKQLAHGGQKALAHFVEAAVQSCVLAEQEAEPQLGANHAQSIRPDALAKLIGLMLNSQASANGFVRTNKLAYLETILSLVILVLAQHSHDITAAASHRAFFRIFSALIFELRPPGNFSGGDMPHESLVAIGKSLLALQPRQFPAFAFAWLSLTSHRVLMPALLAPMSQIGNQIYCDLLSAQIGYVGELLKPLNVSQATKDLYRGTLKLLLVLHHDFPTFLAEHAFLLLRRVPPHCTQMRSLIVSASPSNLPELPDPFMEGLKDTLHQRKDLPIIQGDFDRVVAEAGLDTLIKHFLGLDCVGLDSDDPERIVQAIEGFHSAETGNETVVNTELLQAVIIYIARQSERPGRDGTLTFSPDASPAYLLELMVERFSPEARYLFLSTVANHLRYPNAYTVFFANAMLHLFQGPTSQRTQAIGLDIQQQIVRVLIERIVVHRPHSWGLIVTLLELLKNRTYRLFDTPFVKAAPEIERMLNSLLQQMGQASR